MRSVSAYLTRTVVTEEGVDMSRGRDGRAAEGARRLRGIARAKYGGAGDEDRGAGTHNRGGVLAVDAAVDFDGGAAAAGRQQLARGRDLRQRMRNERLA